jgi:hypothetical protein
MTTTLTYAIKYVSSMENAVRFHRDQLGLSLRFESPHWSEPRRLRLCTGSSSPGSKTRTARSAVSVGSALPSVAPGSNKR